MELNVVVKQKAKNAYIIELDGALTTHNYGIFEKEIDSLLSSSPQTVVLNMENLDYLSSAGVRVILKARGALKKNNGKLVYMNLQPQIKKVFDIINALPSMQIFKNIDELDQYLDAMQKKVKSGEI